MAVDSQWGNTSLLLPLSENLLDARGHTMTASGGIALSSAVGTPFGAGSALYCDGTNDVLTSTSSDFTLGTDDCSIQFWFYPVTGGHGASYARLFAIGAFGVSGSLYIASSGMSDPMKFYFEYYNAGYSQLINEVATTITSNAWHFFQLDRVAGVWSSYIDGTLYSTQSTSINLTQTTLAVGANTASTLPFNGYFFDVRVTKGSYRSSHAVPSEPFPSPPDGQWYNAVLFMPCDSTGVVDVKGKTPTLTGGGPVASSTQSLTGGYSLYFDGADDKVTFPASSAWDFSGGNAEISFSIYPTALPGAGNWCRLFMIGANGSTSALTVQFRLEGDMQFGVPGGATLCATPAGTVTAGSGGVFQRYEISLSSGVARIFKDGVLVGGPTTITAQVSSSSNSLVIGYDTVATVNFKYQGYLDRVRLTKLAGHTSAFTDDTNPFPRPSISGVTRNGAGDLASKVVKAFKRSTAALVGSAVSNAGTGAYAIYPDDYFIEHFVVEFDTSTDPLVDGGSGENSLIYDRVIPG